MNKNLDLRKYHELESRIETDFHQRKVLRTRIIKFSFIKIEETYLHIGEELFYSGRYQKSIPPLKRATIISPRETDAQILLAKAFFKLQKENEAYSSIKTALSLSPQDDQVHQFLIETLEEQHRLEDLESFSKEIANMIKDPEEIPFFYFETAEALKRCGKHPQAFLNYEKAFESDSMKDYHHYSYGLALHHQGLFEEAIVQFEQTRKLNPSNKLAFNGIAHLNYCLGRVEKALEGFEYIIENGLAIFVTYSNFILVLHHLDQDEEVISTYRNLLQPFIISHGHVLPKLYQEESRITQMILQRDDLDEITREFHTKKLKGINLVLSFLN